MKLTSVEFLPANSDLNCVLSFRDPGRGNPYNVKTIVGLDADDITPRFYGPGNAPFYDLSIEKRVLVARIVLNPRPGLNESYSSLRDNLYKIISSSRTGLVQILFKNGTDIIASVSGFVTKMEAAHFEKEQQVQISFSCPDPMLRAPVPVSIPIGGLNPALLQLTDDLSTAPHGFAFALHMVNNLADLAISLSGDTSWSFNVIPAGGFLYDDMLYFSSEYNNKYLYIIRPGVVDPIYLADKIVAGSVWPVMFPGENPFVFTHPTDVVFQSITYYPTYWGV